MNTVLDHRRPIVVGIDGSPAASHAVRWAAAEAVARQLPLTLLHAYADPADRFPGKDVADAIRSALRVHARRWLRTALNTAHERAPGLKPHVELRMGAIVPTLLDLSGDAAMVVLGERGVGGFTGMLVGSTANSVVAGAQCPVVVVRTPPLRNRPIDGPVVVGVDGSPASEAAIKFAFDEASSRGRELVAVHTWNEVFLDPELNVARIAFDTNVLEERERELLAQRLAGWQEKYPDVPVRRVVVQGRPMQVLMDHGADAEILVVGSRGRGGFEGMLLGSTSQALVHYSPCPLVVVKP